MSLIPNTYNGIVSAIKALAEDDSTEFEAYIPTAIYLTEERLIKELDTEGVKTIVSVTAASGNPLLAKPDNYRLGFELFYTASGSAVLPRKKTTAFCKDYWPVVASTDHPKYYSDWDNSYWYLAPTPDRNYEFTAQVTRQVEHISASNQTNYLTSNCSDALFYGTMSKMSQFMKDFSTFTFWEQEYNNTVIGLNNEGRRGRRDNANDPKNSKSGINTLKGDN